ncbi:protein kinase [Nonomuraea sp. NPDC050153]|uniref:protein kinase domain-containing protein n=1 Tax=Nonomuraea sp. NPDC050153 TaxID=3364359 RepID=UPI00378932DC
MKGTVLLAGRYNLVEPLGPGGGTWLARDAVLHRDVAVKRIPLTATPARSGRDATTGERPDPGPGSGSGSGERERERVLAAARFAASLSHPGLVTVHDVIATGPQLWVVMDLIRGGSLDRVSAAEGPLEPGRVAAMGLRLLDALAVVHARGHVHGAVTPGNVLVAATGETVLTGLGTTAAPSITAASTTAADMRMLVATLMFALDGGATPRPDDVAASSALLPRLREAAAFRAALAGARDGAEIRAVLTQAAARAAAMAAEAPTAPTKVSSTGTNRTLWLSVAAATALIVTVVTLAMARPGTTTRGPTAATTTIAAPSPSRTPAAAPSPDPCATVVPTDRVLPSKSSTCSVTVDGAAVTIKTQPDVATARKVFDALRKRRQSQTGTSKVERAVTTPVKNVPGLGDECFSQDSTVGILSSVSSHVWLRVRTMVIEVSVMENGPEVTSEMRDTAMRAARTTAARLQGSS